MKLSQLQEARYYRHPILTWIDDQISKPDSAYKFYNNVSGGLYKTLTPDEYDTLRKILPREFGEPKERQDGMHWVLKNNDKRYYMDLQKLFGPPVDQSRRLTISSID